jgi:hypothetical protein
MNVPFDELPDDARLWIVAADRPLNDAAAGMLRRRVDAHLEVWHAHGTPVRGGCELRYGRFLLVGADERASGVSGCSIDSLFRVLKDVEREAGVKLLDVSPVWYRDGQGEVRSAPRAGFREAVKRGEVDAETIVYDNTVSTVGALRGGEWEKPLNRSWHAEVFLR